MKREIMNLCSELFEVPIELIISSSRYGEITAARFALYKALRLRGWSYPRIGKFVGRDHASIIHGARKAEYKMERSSIYAEKVNALASWQPEALRLLTKNNHGEVT